IRMQGGGAVPAFRYGTVDLNGDGRLESIVLLQGAEWCRAGGCRLLVFRGDDEGALLVSSATAAAEPVRIAAERTGGWHDLIVRSEGKGDVVLRFDGTGYPSNPSMQPQATPEQVEAAQELPMTQVAQPTTSRETLRSPGVPRPWGSAHAHGRARRRRHLPGDCPVKQQVRGVDAARFRRASWPACSSRRSRAMPSPSWRQPVEGRRAGRHARDRMGPRARGRDGPG